jgi:plastocyanin
MQTQIRISTLALAAAVLLAGCKPDAALKKAEVVGRGSLPGRHPSEDSSTVTGTITFKGPAPKMPRLDTSMDPACALGGGVVSSESIVGNKNRLANVYVYIKTGAPTSDAIDGTQPVVLDQRSCRYKPHVIAVQRGGVVEFRNSDPTMHAIHTVPQTPGEASIDISQGLGAPPQQRKFIQPEVMLPVRCPLHPWMSAFINVADNPFFAVSATDGTFKITGLPPGDYTLAAVHETLGEQDVQFTVAPRSRMTQDFTFSEK